MSTTKMKGLLKGLRYISQMFDADKEQEMQIGNPTDVKHVAHIGCDGPSASSPGWMNEFQGAPSPASKSGPLPSHGDDFKDDESVSSQGSSLAPPSSCGDLTERGERAKSSLRKQALTGESTKSEKAKSSRRSKTKGEGGESLSQKLREKKARRKKPKEKTGGNDGSVGGGGGSSRPSSRSKGEPNETYESPFSEPGPGHNSKSDKKLALITNAKEQSRNT